jgi:hypothetical protein
LGLADGVALGHHLCADCKTKSPETELSYALTLNLAGWRETKLEDPTKSEWRCPACWAKHKRATRAKTQFNLPSIGSIGRKEDE